MTNIRPLTTQNSLGSNFSQVNDMVRQLNNEQTTKVFKQPGGYSSIQGKLPYEGGYGALYYDQDNLPRIIIGVAPDGQVGVFVSKPGISILEAFS